MAACKLVVEEHNNGFLNDLNRDKFEEEPVDLVS